MSHTLTQVDAFTDRAFGGNPAAVLVLPAPADEAWMQSVATEMNLSETAFVHPEKDGFRLRWFTPRLEVDLCGHATLAAAHVLWEDGTASKDAPLLFHTKSGLLTATRAEPWIELDFPAEFEEYCAAPMELTEALGVAMHYVGKNRFDYLIEVENEATLRGLEPDFAVLESVPARGFIVTCGADSPGTTLSPASLHPARACGKTRSPVPPIAASPPSGPPGSARTPWSDTRHPFGAAWFACASRATALSSAGRPLPYCGDSSFN